MPAVVLFYLAAQRWLITYLRFDYIQVGKLQPVILTRDFSILLVPD